MELLNKVDWLFVLKGTGDAIIRALRLLKVVFTCWGLVSLGVVGGIAIQQGAQILPLLLALLLIAFVVGSIYSTLESMPDEDDDEEEEEPEDYQLPADRENLAGGSSNS